MAGRPWERDALAPGLRVPPGLGAAVEEAVALAPEPSTGLAAGRVAPRVSTPAVAAAIAAPAPEGASAEPALAVSAARPVQSVTATPVSSPPPEPPAPVAPEPTVVPAPVPPPQQAPAPPIFAGGGGQGSPGAAAPGGFDPEPECEGDEYTVTIGFAAGAEMEEELPVEILIQRLESDGTLSELRLEGDLSDANALVELLSAEGNCVEVVLEPVLDEEGEADAGDGAGAPAGAPSPG